MIQTALETPSDVDYYGFDFFSGFTIEMAKKEIGNIINHLNPATEDDAYNKLKGPGVNIELFKGNTKETLPEFVQRGIVPDLVFIDGGHDFDTVESDWFWIEQIIHPHTIIVFDDYTSESETCGWGCNKVIEALDKDMYSVEILTPCDTYNAPISGNLNKKIKSDTSFVKVCMN